MAYDLRRARRGTSLVELTIGMGILALILGAVLDLHLQGLRIYQDVAAADWATFDAATAVDRMEQSIEGCFRVTGRYASRITISLPLTAWSADVGAYLPVEPLTQGDQTRYYLADATGRLGTTGTYLWRAVEGPAATGFTVDPKPMADNIASLQLTYTMMPSPRAASVATVELVVQARCKEGGTTVLRTHRARIALRNAAYGPVTTENGVDSP